MRESILNRLTSPQRLDGWEVLIVMSACGITKGDLAKYMCLDRRTLRDWLRAVNDGRFSWRREKLFRLIALILLSSEETEGMMRRLSVVACMSEEQTCD